MKVLTGLGALLASLPLYAEPAVFQDQVLSLDKVLVQRPQGPALYGNVELERRPNGEFVLGAFDTLRLADVQSITVERDQYPPGTVIVVANGFASTPCVEVAPAVVTRVGTTFHFAFEELPPPDNVSCTAQRAPMMEAFGIPTTDLAPGDYEIVYGELHVQFTLHPAP